MNIKTLLLFIVTTFFSLVSIADEGLWLPILLQQLNEPDMKSMGLRLTADDIYSINNSSLKDAVCLFGGGCTAEVVSDKGLILTNHHCGYSTIQSHSSQQNNYLNNGFWANDFKDELSNPGLSVTFIVSMEDVTDKVLYGVSAGISEEQRNNIIKLNSEKIEKEAIKNTHYKAKVKSFYYGNEFYLFITEVFTDIRLVGAPPDAIGRFGGDTDNWEWPRHTGDFCVFRIYADTNNNPADYSLKNVPYKSKKSLTISLKGEKKDDFTMVYGFPGTTEEYLTSYAVNLTANIEDPARVAIRAAKLKIMDAAMKTDPVVNLQYASKYVNIANYWKKWAGEMTGLKRMTAVEQKKKLEANFNNWVNADNARKAKYGNLISAFEKVYSVYSPFALAYDYFSEAGVGIEIIKNAWGYNNLITKSRDTSVKTEDITKLVEQMKNGSVGFFKNYDQSTDKKILIALLEIYQKADLEFKPEIFTAEIKEKYNGDVSKCADYLYKNSSFVSLDKVQKLLSDFRRDKLKKFINDPMYIAAAALYTNFYKNILPAYNACNDKFDSMYRIYINGLREMETNKKFYPDANLSLRVAYGKVEGYKPRDAVDYNYYTTMAGIMEKEDTTIADYKVPAKLKELYKNKDFGRYAADDKTMHVAFIASNHTSGGNSGSPVLNGEGQLIGINFDRVWEGTMSDIMFDPDHCRNISLDIRYALFIIDKFAGAKHLINEMKIVE
jgi:V8-like Glu-specific endopeptidase